MFARLLVWIVVAIAVWWILRPRRRSRPPQDAARPPTSATPAMPVAESMVHCAACGLHFPASGAVRDGARVFCCTAHRDAGPRGGQ